MGWRIGPFQKISRKWETLQPTKTGWKFSKSGSLYFLVLLVCINVPHRYTNNDKLEGGNGGCAKVELEKINIYFKNNHESSFNCLKTNWFVRK